MKAMHREVEQAYGMYVLRQSNEAYRGEFVQENEVLRSENTFRGRNLPTLLRLSVVRPRRGPAANFKSPHFYLALHARFFIGPKNAVRISVVNFSQACLLLIQNHHAPKRRTVPHSKPEAS
jgi:hypothetical protein